jgi:chromate reductase, NAD(P)H dehydrogenase (quinone)
MRITAFGASTSKHSINRELVKHVLKSFTGDDINLIDLNDFEMPVYSVDKEKEGFPPQAQNFIDQFTNCDLIIISMTEHNAGPSAAMKNTLDWASRKVERYFQDKPVFLLSTSPGKGGARFSMEYAKMRFPKHGATILESFSLPLYNENFDPEKGVLDETLALELEEKIRSVREKM